MLDALAVPGWREPVGRPFASVLFDDVLGVDALRPEVSGRQFTGLRPGDRCLGPLAEYPRQGRRHTIEVVDVLASGLPTARVHASIQAHGRSTSLTFDSEYQDIGYLLMRADDISEPTDQFAAVLTAHRGVIWCRTGSADPAERQAEMFSASLLMSRDDLLAALPQRPWRGWRHVYELADTFRVNVTPMKIRLEQLGWMHLDDDDGHQSPALGRRPVSRPSSTFECPCSCQRTSRDDLLGPLGDRGCRCCR